MCGRYICAGEEERDTVNALISRLTADSRLATFDFENNGTNADSFPGDTHSILLPGKDGVCSERLRWGFDRWNGKGLLINARLETAARTYVFQPFIRHRCIIPAKGYYEWKLHEKGNKTRYTFFPTDTGCFFLGGLWKQDATTPSGAFVILTVPARPEFSAIHDRMPLLLRPDDAYRWFFDAVDPATFKPLSDTIAISAVAS